MHFRKPEMLTMAINKIKKNKNKTLFIDQKNYT